MGSPCGNNLLWRTGFLIGRVLPVRKRRIEVPYIDPQKRDNFPAGDSPCGELSGAKLTGLWYSVEQPIHWRGAHTAGADHCPLVTAQDIQPVADIAGVLEPAQNAAMGTQEGATHLRH